MMIDAEMYGMIPSANTVKRDKAPPENMLNRLRRRPVEQLLELRRVNAGHGNVRAHAVNDQREQQKHQPAAQIAVLAGLRNGCCVSCHESP